MKKILIVDDSKSIQKAISWRLESHGYQIIGTASNGEEGFAKYKELKPDLTILDLTMPYKDGKECLQEIINLDAQAKVVMLSALTSESTINDCLKIGALSFINKDSLMQDSFIESEIDRIFALINKKQ